MRAAPTSRSVVLGSGAALLGLLGSLWPAPARALTKLHIGIGVQAGFNSQLVRNQTDTTGSVGSPALLLSASPWVSVETEMGRISELLRYQFFIDTFLLLSTGTPAYSYQNTLTSQTRIDLTSRLQWNLGVQGTQGQINSFAQTQNPTTRDIAGVNLTATDFLTVGVNSNLLWDPTARIRVTQPIAFRSFIPYGTVSTVEAGNPGSVTERNATLSFQSYSLDGGVGVDHQWARASLGGEVRVGWFRPQTGIDPLAPDPSLLTGQAILRTVIDLAPRWKGEVQGGVFTATQAGRAFQKETTLVAPVAGAQLSYLFPRVEWTAAIGYQHFAAGEVFLGRLTETDLVSARLNVPLPKEIALSASAGYRYARISETDRPVTDPPTPAASGGQSYHLVQLDAGIGWLVRDGVSLYARYQYLRQSFVGGPAVGQPALADYDGHLAFVGVALVYPTR